MRKLLIISGLIVFGLAVTIKSNALPGLGNVTGTKTESVVKDVAKTAIVSETNKKIAAKAANCSCNVNAGTVSGCDYSGIRDIVNNARTGLQTALNRDAQFYVTSESQGCATEVQSNITGWWYWHTMRAPGFGPKMEMKLK